MVPQSLLEELKSAFAQATKNGWLVPIPNYPDFYHLTQKGLDDCNDIQVYPLNKPNRRINRYSIGESQETQSQTNSTVSNTTNNSVIKSQTATTIPSINNDQNNNSNNNNNSKVSNSQSLSTQKSITITQEPKLSLILKKNDTEKLSQKFDDKISEKSEEKPDKKSEKKNETRLEKEKKDQKILIKPKINKQDIIEKIEDSSEKLLQFNANMYCNDISFVQDNQFSNKSDNSKLNTEVDASLSDSLSYSNFQLTLKNEGWNNDIIEINKSLNKLFTFYSKTFTIPTFYRFFFAKSLYFDCQIFSFLHSNLNLTQCNDTIYLLKPISNLFYNSPIIVKGSDLIIMQRNFDDKPNEMLLHNSFNLFSDYHKSLIKFIYDYVLRSEFFTPIYCYFKMNSQISELEVLNSDQFSHNESSIDICLDDNSISPFSTQEVCSISSYRLLFLCSFSSYIEASKLLEIPLEDIILYFNGTNTHPNLHFILASSTDYENIANDGDIGFSYECVNYLLKNPFIDSFSSKNSLDVYKQKFGVNESILCLSPSGYFFHSFLDINHAASVLNLPLMGLKLCLSNNFYGEYAGLLWVYSARQFSVPFEIKYVTSECRGIPLALLISLIKTNTSNKIDLSIPSRSIVGTSSYFQEEDFIPGYSKYSTLRDLSIGCLSLDDVLLHIYRDIFTSSTHIESYPSFILASCYNIIHNHAGFKWKMFDYYYLDPSLDLEKRSRVNPLKLRFFSNLVLKKYGSPIYFFSEDEDNQSEKNINQHIPYILPQTIPNISLPKGITTEDIEEGWLIHPSVNEFLGLRVRRFFPNFGLSNGTVKAFLPPQKNDCIPLWKIIHDDQDCEDFDFVELLQHNYYLKNEIEKFPEIDSADYFAPKIGYITYDEIFQLCNQDFEKIEHMIISQNNDPKYSSDWVVSLDNIRIKRPSPFNSITETKPYPLSTSLCFFIVELLLSNFSVNSNGLTIHEILSIIDINFYPFRGPSSDILVSILGVMFNKEIIKFSGNQIIRFERKILLSKNYFSTRKEVPKKRTYTQSSMEYDDSNIPILCSFIEGKDLVVFKNILEVNKSLGIKPHYIRKICQGARRSTFKLTFKYLNDYVFDDENEQERLKSIEQVKNYLLHFDKSQMTSTRIREFIDSKIQEPPEKSEIRVGDDFQAIIPPLLNDKQKENELKILKTSTRIHSTSLSSYLSKWVDQSSSTLKNSHYAYILRTLIISILFKPGMMAVINSPPNITDVKTNFLQSLTKRDKKLGSVETPIVNGINMLEYQYKISHVCVVSVPNIPTISENTKLNSLKNIENSVFIVYNGQELLEVKCRDFILNMEDTLLDLLSSDFSPYFFKSSIEQLNLTPPTISNSPISLYTFVKRLNSLSSYLASKRWKFQEVYQYFRFNSIQQRKLYSSLRDSIIRNNHSIQEVISFHYKYHLLNCPRYYCQDSQKLILNCFALSSNIFEILENENEYPSLQTVTDQLIPSIASNITSNSFLKSKLSNSFFQSDFKGNMESDNNIVETINEIESQPQNYLVSKLSIPLSDIN